MIEDRQIGLSLAVASTIAIGASFIITKKGLNAAAERNGFQGNGFAYLRQPLWWAGILTMVIGEACNLSAYAFAPATLITPLGALSVLIGAVLGGVLLDETLGALGWAGCTICLLGSMTVVLNAPPEQKLAKIDDLLDNALRLGFITYAIVVAVFAVGMIYRVAPLYGNRYPMVYISICSTVGSISIMAIKGFSIAIKLTLSGSNQFSQPSTYFFAIVVVVCIATQMNYFNKALSQFNTNVVNLLYYVSFTTCTLAASFILFRGFNTSDATNTISLLCGLLTIFIGVYLLSLSRNNQNDRKLVACSADSLGIYHEVSHNNTDGLLAPSGLFLEALRQSGDHAERV